MPGGYSIRPRYGSTLYSLREGGRSLALRVFQRYGVFRVTYGQVGSLQGLAKVGFLVSFP